MELNGAPLPSGRASEARQRPRRIRRFRRRRRGVASHRSTSCRSSRRRSSARGPGEIGALLRREGLYSSHLSAWRKAAREGSLRELGKKRGPRHSGGKREAKKVRKLERENARLRDELRKARIVIEVQGKVAGLLGVSLGDGERS